MHSPGVVVGLLMIVLLAPVVTCVRLELAHFPDGSDTCDDTLPYPELINSDTCLYDADRQAYYAIFEQRNNTAKMMWGCARGCAEAQCATAVLAPFGSCVWLNVSGSSAVRRVRRVITDYTLGVKAFAGPSCNDYISDFGTTTLKSGTCVKSPFEKYIMVYYIDPRDSPASARVTWRARCQPGCMECADGWYEDSAIDLCTAFGNYYVEIGVISSSSDSTDSDGLPVWAVAIIVIASIGGCLCGVLVLAGLGFFVWRRQSKSSPHSYKAFSAINA